MACRFNRFKISLKGFFFYPLRKKSACSVFLKGFLVKPFERAETLLLLLLFGQQFATANSIFSFSIQLNFEKTFIDTCLGKYM